jgi:FKBP-type peptidyl-prolyl cis-trans isomerase
MGRTWAFPLFFAIAVAACEDDVVEPDPRELQYADSLEIDISRMTETSTGLFYEDVTVGAGEVASEGRTVEVLYSGWLPDGRLFDTTADNGVPISFVLGIGEVIEGWDQGLDGMREGGVRKLVIPPSLGYPNGRGPIPPNSVLVFRVELVNVQ